MSGGAETTRALIALALAVSAVGCATTEYQPRLVARGELTLRYSDRFEMVAAGRAIAHGPRWHGLPAFVRCVPRASEHAEKSVGHGRWSLALGIVGGSLGVLSVGGLIGAFADTDARGNTPHLGLWLGTGVGVAVAGVVAAGVSRLLKNSANGHAVDALNYYNDAVGSLGATCDDLRYPAPTAPPVEVPPPPYPEQPYQPPRPSEPPPRPETP